MMDINLKKTLCTFASLFLTIQSQAIVVDFDDNVLAPNTTPAISGAGSFSSNGVTFTNNWNTQYNCCWSNFTYSNQTDTTTAGYLNDRSAITGTDVSGNGNYAVAYNNSSTDANIQFGSATQVNSAYFTNTTYAYLAVADGNDGYGGVKGPFATGDFFTLTIRCLAQNGSVLNTFDFDLADGANVVNSWELVDLSTLGTVYGLSFGLSSSDNGDWGMNTPAYFAMDNLNIQSVPVPASALLLTSALSLFGLLRRKTR